MKRHRIRTATSIIPNDPRRHLFVEIQPDSFIEISPVGLDQIDRSNILALLQKACPKHGPKSMLYAARAFNIGIINDWREEAVVIA